MEDTKSIESDKKVEYSEETDKDSENCRNKWGYEKSDADETETEKNMTDNEESSKQMPVDEKEEKEQKQRVGIIKVQQYLSHLALFLIWYLVIVFVLGLAVSGKVHVKTC